jgi:succinyl-diaminopimelate desuccinylase
MSRLAFKTSASMDEVAAAVEGHRDEIIETLMELVRIPTQTPPGENYDKIVERMLPDFRELGFDARRHDLPKDLFEERSRRYYPALEGVRANLLAEYPENDRPGLALYCHLDTMPAGDLSKWSYEPFQPFVRDGYVWGRGTADSKGGATAILWGLRIVRELGLPLAVRPVVALTTDEEIGPYTGVMHMADTGVFEACRWFYSCDGMADSIAIGANGGFIWTIRIRGRSVHSAASFLGLNPIEHSVPLLTELLKTKRKVATRRSKLPISQEMKRAYGRSHISPVLNVTMARAGVKHNVVPPEYVLEGDRRFIPEEDERACIAEIEDAIARARARDPELECELEVRPFYEPFACDLKTPWFQHIKALVAEAKGSPLTLAGLNGSTDVAHVANVTGLPVAINGLARFAETHNHSPDERCRIDDLLGITKMVAFLATIPYEG